MDPLRSIDAQSAKLENLAKRHFSTTEAIGGFDALQSSDIPSLRERYPQYFDLDASNGLDIYVWQMAENSDSFGLLPHAENQRDLFSSELLNLQGTDADEMCQILSTYSIDENDINIILWANPNFYHMSIGWSLFEGESIEDLEEKQKAYIDSMRNMLFGEQSVPPTVQ